MVDVELHIGGHAYTLSCAPGEEADLRRLAAVVDAEVARARSLGGMTEARQLLFAAIFLAERASGTAPVETDQPLPDAAAIADLAGIAGRIERVAARLTDIADSGA